MQSRTDLYSRITNKIIADLEQGGRTWFKPWSAEHTAGRIARPLRSNFQPYNGVNVLVLWSEAVTCGYSCPVWITYKQSEELGGQVRKGERGSMVVYADRFRKTGTNDKGEEVERDIPFLKAYTVFNADQIDNLPERFHPRPENPLPAELRHAAAEMFIGNTGADIRHGGNQAFYASSHDRIQLPPFEAFKDPEGFYATALHELTHWTRHETRLARDFGRKRWGDEGYAIEELVAEIGSAFLCADTGVTPAPRPDHAAYIASWLTVLRRDNRAIFTAASHAQRAADYLHTLQKPAP
jgi:antirestriction protein ArdC